MLSTVSMPLSTTVHIQVLREQLIWRRVDRPLAEYPKLDRPLLIADSPLSTRNAHKRPVSRRPN
jgi:hypothetical protein